MKPKITVRLVEQENCFGPGMEELLHNIEGCGSIKNAADKMGLSYSKAMKILNRAEKELGYPLVTRYHGGIHGGKAIITEKGLSLMEAYRQYNRQVQNFASEIFYQHFPEKTTMKNLFLEGERGCGKTSTMLKLAKEFPGTVRGFLSVRLVNEEGKTMGFALEDVRDTNTSVQLVKECSIPEKQIFLWGNDGDRRMNLEAFRQAEKIMAGWQNADLLFLDELGGIELQVPEMRELIYTLLSSSLPCIGTIKSQENFMQMQQHLGLSAKEKEALKLREFLENRSDSKILDYNKDNREIIKQKVGMFLQNAE